MQDVFLLPPFTDICAAGVVLGSGAARPGAFEAELDAHFLQGDGRRIGLAPVPGARVAGRVVELDPEAGARLDFLMRALGSVPVGVVARIADGMRPALAYRLCEPDGTKPWDEVERADPVALAQFRETVREVMDHFGRRPAEAMPALMPGIAYRALARARARLGPSVTGEPSAGLSAADVEAEPPVRAYADLFGVEEHRLRYRRFDGRMSQLVERAVFASGDAVTVLPFDPKRGAVLLTEQFRPGAHARRDPAPWLLEGIAGRIDPGETDEVAARREAREEAGLTLGRMERVADYYTSPGVSAEYVTAFVAEADLGGAGGTHGLASESEDIRTLVLPLAEALGLVTAGAARNAPLLVPLLWLGQHYARLRDAWA